MAELSADVVVVGAGMAGLCAAVQAQQLGAAVVLLEKGDAPGGSLALSGGTLWCARTYDDLRRLVPRGDAELGRMLVEEFETGVEWLIQNGASLTRLTASPDRIVYWMEPEARAFVEHMSDRFRQQGGQLLVRTPATHLVVGADGRVEAIGARIEDGARIIHGAAFILATGGFQANPEMRARYYGQWSDRLILRSNPNSTGDGWHMGMAAGAAPSAAMSSFYGHLLPAAPARVPSNDFIAHTMYHSEHSILVNLRGERFTDESLGDETSAQAVARQPEALAFLIFDDSVYQRYAIRPALAGARAVDTFSASRALGARSAVASTIEALCQSLQEIGVFGPALRESIQEYNAAVAESRASHLRIPRRAKANLIASPPFFALAVTPGITFSLGGLRINANAQVLDRGNRPIGGLYAAGADAGGIHNEQYAGGLCLGLVFGRRAAEHALGR